jgi:hypothetical protein
MQFGATSLPVKPTSCILTRVPCLANLEAAKIPYLDILVLILILAHLSSTALGTRTIRSHHPFTTSHSLPPCTFPNARSIRSSMPFANCASKVFLRLEMREKLVQSSDAVIKAIELTILHGVIRGWRRVTFGVARGCGAGCGGRRGCGGPWLIGRRGCSFKNLLSISSRYYSCYVLAAIISLFSFISSR